MAAADEGPADGHIDQVRHQRPAADATDRRQQVADGTAAMPAVVHGRGDARVPAVLAVQLDARPRAGRLPGREAPGSVCVPSRLGAEDAAGRGARTAASDQQRSGGAGGAERAALRAQLSYQRLQMSICARPRP